MLIEIDKAELTEEIEHQRQMVRELRRRRRLLEYTHVTKGIETEPHILMQMEDISRQITEREAEIARLKTFSVEDKESLAEVEYRVAVAETFDTPQGIPSVAGAARLELLRLRLGIPAENARYTELAVRAALAVRELGGLTLEELDIIRKSSLISVNEENQNAILQWNKCIDVCKKLERAILLDRESAVGWCNKIGKPRPEELRVVLLVGNDYFGHFTQQALKRFIRRLEKVNIDSLLNVPHSEQ